MALAARCFLFYSPSFSFHSFIFPVMAPFVMANEYDWRGLAADGGAAGQAWRGSTGREPTWPAAGRDCEAWRGQWPSGRGRATVQTLVCIG
jgi:hypothetical protein